MAAAVEETVTVKPPPRTTSLSREVRKAGDRLVDLLEAIEAAEDPVLLEETETVPRAEETLTVEAPPQPPSPSREDRKPGDRLVDLLEAIEAAEDPIRLEETETVPRAEETPTVEAPALFPPFPSTSRETDKQLDWAPPAETAEDPILLEETETVPTTAEETPTIEAPPQPPSLPREDPVAGDHLADWLAPADSADDLMSLEETETMPATAEATPTVDLTAEQPVVRSADFTIRPAARLGERVRRTSSLLGLLGLFVVYVTRALALLAVAPAVGLGWTSVVITSGSMSPLIRNRRRGGPLPHDGGGLVPGAVVVFSDPARPGLVTHRIESINPDGSYVTRGDANRQPDSTPLPPEQVVGVAKLRVPLIGLPLVWYWARAWGKLVVWVAGTLLALWLARYALLQKYNLRAQPEESSHVPG